MRVQSIRADQRYLKAIYSNLHTAWKPKLYPPTRVKHLNRDLGNLP